MHIIRTKKIVRIFAVFIFVAVSAIAFVSTASAATLSLSPSKTKVSVGDTFRVTVTVDSQSVVINNAESMVHFSSENAAIVSLDTSKSIFTLWPEQPSFSNTNGTVSFNGGIVNPGYTGNGAQVLSFLVRAKNTGTIQFSFSDTAIRANDGLGTDVASGTGKTAVAVVPAVVIEKEKPITIPSAPMAVVPDSRLEALNLASTTHPDQTVWYNTSAISVSWKNPAGSLGTQILFGGGPEAEPKGSLVNFTHKEYPTVRDGVSYFHARYKTAGGWSPTGTYSFHIDTTAPDQVFVSTKTREDGRTALVLKGMDTLSGVDYFAVTVDDQPTEKVKAYDGAALYLVPGITHYGSYGVIVSAYDRAGNIKTTHQSFIVDTLPAPILNSVPERVAVGAPIAVSGTSAFTNTQISVFVRLPNSKVEEYAVDTDAQGTFEIALEKTRVAGYYEVWSQFTNERGETSITSKHSKVLALATPFQQFKQLVIDHIYSVLLVGFAFLGVVLLFLRIRNWYRISNKRQKV